MGTHKGWVIEPSGGLDGSPLSEEVEGELEVGLEVGQGTQRMENSDGPISAAGEGGWQKESWRLSRRDGGSKGVHLQQGLSLE